MKPITQQVVEAIHANLKEFGYDSLTLEFVQTEVAKLVAGTRPTGIIGMFAKNMLEKNGYLEEANRPGEGPSEEDKPC